MLKPKTLKTILLVLPLVCRGATAQAQSSAAPFVGTWVVVTLKPEGETMALAQMMQQSQTIKRGTATRQAESRVALTEERTTTLHVGDVAVLHIPSDRRYQHSANGAWQDVLALVEPVGEDMVFRAVRAGEGVIIISPDAADGQCISCATLHYFIKVVR